MTLSTGGSCPICGDVGCDKTLMASVPIGIAGVPIGNGQRKTGRFFTTTERVWRNNRLVVGVGQPIPWEQAQHLGLVPSDEPTPPPVEEAPSTPLVDAGDDTLVPEEAATPEVAAVVRRRKGTVKK